MSQKELRTNLIIGGKTTAGFMGLVNKLEAVGALVDRIGSKVREWEGDAVEVYKDYETLMLEAEGAMTTQYKSASQRAQVMAELEEHVADWAANSIFHTDDMARAVNEAAHAGWTFEEMLEGIPVAMNLAQAGNISLSEGLDDLIKTLNATGMGTEYAETMVDQWTMAANSSATTVAELGDAMKAMGAVAQFGGSTEELFTMLAVLADTGTVGSRAGTLLRNSMLRLIAPTKKAAEAMEELELTEEEMEELAADSGQLEKANALLEAQGFSAYDANGKLKPFLQTFKELDVALEGMNEEDKYNVLAAIFPTRTITGAMAMLKAATEDYGGLLENMADSEGYASRIAKIQTSGLMGSTELLKSKEEELKRKVGKILSDPLENLQEAAGDFLDVLNAMPQETLAGLTGAATALGTMGPGLMIGGAVIKAIAALGPWGTAFVVAATGAAGLVSYLSALNEIKFEDHFGTMQLDLEQLGTYVEGTAGKLTAEQEAVEKWSGALADAQKNYTDLTAVLSEELMFDTLTGKQLTDKEIDQLEGYGKSIGKSLLTGIGSARQRDMDFLDVLFGDAQTDEETDTMIMAYDVVDSWYDNLFGRAEAVSEELRKQLASALDGGVITEEERDQIINKTIDTMNEIQSAIADRMDRQAYYEELSKAGAVSWDSASEYLNQLDVSMNQKIAENEALYHREWGIVEAAIEDAVKNGTAFNWNGEDVVITDANREEITQRIRDEFNSEWKQTEQKILDDYGEFIMAVFTALMNDSEYADAWRLMQKASVDEDGSLDMTDMFAGMTADELEKASNDLTTLYQGLYDIAKRLPEGFFKTDKGEQIQMLLGRADQAAREAGDLYPFLRLSGYDTMPTQAELDALEQQAEVDAKRANLKRLENELQSVNAEIAERERRIEEKGDWKDWWYNFTNGVASDYAALHGGEWNPGGLYARRESLAQQVEEAREAVGSDEGVDVPVTISGGTEAGAAAVEEVQAAIDETGSVGVPVEVTGTSEAAALAAQLLQQEALSYKIWYQAQIRAPGYTWPTVKAFGEGGRATEPSIFGETEVPEWAIPEEHTPRTADLIRKTAEASGFDLGELAARYGETGGVTVNTTYAPTINAADAASVDEILQKDKRRTAQIVKDAVREALREQRFRDSVEVYA